MTNLIGQVQKALQERSQGVLSNNKIPNPEEELKAITTRSSIVLVEHSVPLPPLSSSSSNEVERYPKTITDQVLPENTIRVPPSVVQTSPSTLSSVIPGRNPHQPPIPYPSRLNKEKIQDKFDIQIHKFLQMFKKLHFNISLDEALALMPKYHKMLKDLLSDKEKLLGLENTLLTKNCLALLLKKLPKKLRDLGKFLIPCDFPMVEICMALADLGASINLMVLSIWKKCCIDEDVFIQVGKFTFLADFVVVNYDVNPHGDEKLIFYADSTSNNPYKHGDESINMINFIDITCEDHFNEVLNVQKSNHPLSGSPTLSSDPMVESLFPSLTPFGDIDLLLEEAKAFLSLDDSIPSVIDNGVYDSEGDILFLEELLNDEILRDLPLRELKDDEPSTTKSLIKKPLGIDNEIYESEGDILFLEYLLNDDPIKDLHPNELNNDSEGDILFLENLLKDEPLETERSKIYTLIGEPSDTFLMGHEEIKFNPFKDIDDLVQIPRVSETPLDSFDSSLDSFDTAFTNPLFELDSEYTLNYDNPIFDI
ncbi:hypothetical protein Tco_0563911 [Tanacetum coccineum]